MDAIVVVLARMASLSIMSVRRVNRHLCAACNGLIRQFAVVCASVLHDDKRSRQEPCWSCVALVAAAAPLALTTCQSAAFDPREPVGQWVSGSVGQPERMILIDSRVIMLTIVMPSIGATRVLAWWFRVSHKKARHLPKLAFSGSIKLVV